jgi:hypothetical protein
MSTHHITPIEDNLQLVETSLDGKTDQIGSFPTEIDVQKWIDRGRRTIFPNHDPESAA